MTTSPAAARFAPSKRSGLPQAIAGFAGLSLVALSLIGCAQQPEAGPQGVRRNNNTSEYFPQGRYGTASPRVVADGAVVPRGGGRALVGKPYTIAGKRYFPREMQAGFSQTGKASWYGDAFHGRKTANGEIYDMSAISAAHPTMPLPSYARVTNLGNGRSIIVRVNDRGPYHGGRVIDLSKRVADALDFRRFGTANVKVDYIRPAGVAGSDDRQLLASLRTDGTPADMNGGSGGTMLAGLTRPPEQPPFPQPSSAPRPAPAMASAAAAPGPVIQSGSVTTAPAATPGPSQALAIAPPQRPVQQPLVPEPEEQVTTVPRSGRSSPSVPVPPSRPLDLATIPGASVPISAPPRRPQASGSPFGTLTFFAPANPARKRILARDPQRPLRAEDLGLSRR